ncbi:MAG: hypothetical protein BroJett040_25780 [Oligoflexia bacterium]|nr:MAG: hypothetical protein BroJett040_25780 [Oligoflexia bacterium]
MKIQSLYFLFTFTILSLPFITGCSTGTKSKYVTPAPVTDEIKARQDLELAQIEINLEKQLFRDVELSIGEFQAKYPNSIFWYRSQIDLARSLQGLGKWKESTEILRDTIEANQARHLNVTALAFFYISFSYDALGDEAKSLAALLDAQNLKSHLPIEIAQAELPARLAAYYNRVGQTKLAREYFREAERGVATLFSGDKPASRDARARTYYWMGAYSTNQISYENLQSALDTLSFVQIFSLRAMEAQSEGWSARAEEGLKENYRDIWNTIMQLPRQQGLDPFAAERELKEVQYRWLGQVLRVTHQLKLYRAPEVDQKNEVVKEFFEFLNDLEERANDQMLAIGEYNPLTPDAQKRQSLKKSGTIQAKPQFPNETQPETKVNTEPLPSKGQDPNLIHQE